MKQSLEFSMCDCVSSLPCVLYIAMLAVLCEIKVVRNTIAHSDRLHVCHASTADKEKHYSVSLFLEN
jgi:hypothetical protein